MLTIRLPNNIIMQISIRAATSKHITIILQTYQYLMEFALKGMQTCRGGDVEAKVCSQYRE